MFEKIFQEGVLVHLHIRRWGGQVSLSPQDLGIDAKDVPAEFILGKKYLIPTEALGNIRAVELRARRDLSIRSFKFPIGSLSFVPKRILVELKDELDDEKAEFYQAVDSLVEQYEELVKQSGKRFTRIALDLWERSNKERDRLEFVKDFLHRIRVALPGKHDLIKKFSFQYSMFTLAIPDGNIELAELNAEAMQQYRHEAQQQIHEFLEEVVVELRNQTYEVCTRVASSIAQGKVVTENTMQSLKDFINHFQQLNFTGDRAISEQLKDLRDQYLSYGAKDIREKSELQTELRQALEAVANKASEQSQTDISKITGRIKRKLELD